MVRGLIGEGNVVEVVNVRSVEWSQGAEVFV